jgi:hypothetical protein
VLDVDRNATGQRWSVWRRPRTWLDRGFLVEREDSLVGVERPRVKVALPCGFRYSASSRALRPAHSTNLRPAGNGARRGDTEKWWEERDGASDRAVRSLLAVRLSVPSTRPGPQIAHLQSPDRPVCTAAISQFLHKTCPRSERTGFLNRETPLVCATSNIVRLFRRGRLEAFTGSLLDKYSGSRSDHKSRFRTVCMQLRSPLHL